MDLYVKPDSAPDNLEMAEYFRSLCRFPAGAKERQGPIRAIIGYLVDTQILRRWSTALANRYGRKREEIEDIQQIISVELVTRLKNFTEDDVRYINALYMQNLYQVAKSAVTKFLGSAGATGLSGMSGHVRRQFAVTTAKRELVTAGVPAPTNQQIIEQVEVSNAGFKDPVKSGRVITESDLTPVQSSAVDWKSDLGVAEAANREHHPGAEFEASDLRYEMTQAVRALSQHIAERNPDDPDLLAYAHSWMRFTYEGEKPTAALISADTGIEIVAIPKISRRFRYEMTRFRTDNTDH